MTMTSATGVPTRLRGAVLRYRVMAYLTGVLLIILTIGVVIKYTAGGSLATTVVTIVGITHGWLYMIYLVVTADLGIRARFDWGRIFLIALAGTVPAMSFVAEHNVMRGFSQSNHA